MTVGLSEAVRQYTPDEPLVLDCGLVATNLRSSRRGLSPGLGGTRNEHPKLILEDAAAFDDFGQIAQRMAQADIPAAVAVAQPMCRTTALIKACGKIRATNSRDAFPRLVARTLAQQLVDRLICLLFEWV